MGIPETDKSVAVEVNRELSNVIITCCHARRWRTYLTCGGLVLGISLSGKTLGQDQSSKNAETNAKQPGVPKPLAVIPDYSGSIDQSACQPSQDSHQADLCIAWRAAVATEDQAFWAKVACWVGVFGIGFVVRTLHYTRIAAEAARLSAQAAERSIQESAKALAHAQVVADRDFRPWLTIDAKLTSPVGVRYSLEKGEITFFIELSCVNVGKTAARNTVYFVRGIDQCITGNIVGWFDDLTRAATDAAYGDFGSLAPSERHTSRRWCRVPGPRQDSPWHGMPRGTCQFRVGIVAAYRGDDSDNSVFYTAKVLPVGYSDSPEFLDIIEFKDLPLGTGDISLGPVSMAHTI